MKNYGLIVIASFALILSCNQPQQNEGNQQEADQQEPGKWITPGEDDQKTIQTALLTAQPGDTVFFDEGLFQFTSSLSLGVGNVMLKGKGMDKTIFSFKDQTEGAEGLMVKADNFVIEDMAIEDTKGDGIKVQDADGVVFRRLRVEWTGGEDSTNGSYGLYPVSSKNILMEECVAIGASDAGIYVGQSENAIVRNNRVERNVAGIEIENTDYAEVYGNLVTNNTGGIMIFDLPELPKKNGKYIKVYNNEVRGNNHPNFSPMGISVSIVPAGLGLLFMACQHVEAYDNQIIDNQSLGTAIVNLDQMGRKTDDSLYSKYPSAIYLHDNYYERSESIPDTSRELGKMFYELFGENPPNILYDGSVDPALADNGQLTGKHRICIQNNENADFYNLATKSGDASIHDCQLEPVPDVEFTNEMIIAFKE